MKYDENLAEIVKKALKENKINEKMIDQIIAIVRKIYYNWCHFPLFNGLKFDSIDDPKSGPLKVIFKSHLNDVDYTIELINETKNKIVLKDDKGYFVFEFTDTRTYLKFLYNDDVIIFDGHKETEDNELADYIKKIGGYSSVKVGYYANVEDINIEEYTIDYKNDFKVKEIHSGNYYFYDNTFFRSDKDGHFKIETLEKLDFALLFAINYYKWIQKHYEDDFAPVLSRKLGD